MRITIRSFIAATALALSSAAPAATQFSSADYDVYPGDFNGDGKGDLLYIGKRPDKPSGIALADAGGTPQMGFQSWPSNYLNIAWSNGDYKAIIADFNNDNQSDILLQRQTPGNSYILTANSNANTGSIGQIVGIAQGISQNHLGIGWSADQHRIIPGDFDGDGHDDLFFQATSNSGVNAVVLAAGQGGLFTRTSNHCWSGGPQQCWSDSDGAHYGFAKWNSQAVVVHAGDFSGDLKSDLLVQARPKIVMIDYEIPIPVPTFAPGAFGIVKAQTIDGNGRIFVSASDLWSSNERGANWSPLASNLVIGDFDGDGRDDVFVQSRSAGRANVLNLGHSNGLGQLQSATSLASNVSGWSGSDYQLSSGRFGGSARSVLHLQATSASGSNYYSSDITQGSVTAYSSNLQHAPSTPAPATGVGATFGSADVSPSGGASYTIPVTVPAGTAQLTPKLAFQYQQSTTNGLLGLGWNISGLSVIARCPQTIAQDGVTRGANLLSSDQYCLDGNRLRLTHGAQGAASSQYRTELETYSRTIAHGAGTNGPTWFEVWQKDGLIYEYGNSADSRIAVPGTSTTRVWALSGIRDRANNYISVSYVNDSTNPVPACQETNSWGSYRPCQIKYTGNSQQSINPQYTIQFLYEARNTSERVVRHYLGSPVEEKKRLKHVEVWGAGTLIRKYTLTYNTAPNSSQASRVATIQECSSTECLPATSFGWTDLSVAQGLPAVTGTSLPSQAGVSYGFYPPWTLDIDGDGTQDRLVYNGCDFTLTRGAVKGQQIPAALSIPFDCNASFTPTMGVTDLDGDGRQDFLFRSNASGYSVWWVRQRSDLSFAAEQALLWTHGVTGAASLHVDVDGDGYQDLVSVTYTDTSNVYVLFHNRDGSPGYEGSTQVAWTAPYGTSILSQSFVLYRGSDSHEYRSQLTSSDVNGDGLQDVLVQMSDGWRVLYSNGSSFTTGDLLVPYSTGSGTTIEYTTPVALDVNGDTCTDFAFPNSGSTWSLAISKCGVSGGSGFHPIVDTGHSVSSPTHPMAEALDLDLDGNQDLLQSQWTQTPPAPGGYVRSVMFSTTTGLASPVTMGPATWEPTKWEDFDGDGIPDKSGGAGYFSASGPRPNMLIAATDGFGNSVRFDYAPLSDSAVYSRGVAAAGSTRNIGGPTYVVKQMETTDGVGGKFALRYKYEQGRVNVQGRGHLGFAKRTVTDSRTGFVTEEIYDQSLSNNPLNWAIAGRLNSATVRQYANGPIVSQTEYTWSTIAPDGVNNRRWPYVSQKVHRKYELNNGSSPFATVTTSTLVDNYGTPYDVTVTSQENATGLHATSSSTQRRYTPLASIFNDTANWCISRPERIQAIHSHTLTHGTQNTRTVDQDWDGQYCRLTDRIVEPGSSWELTSHFDYDNFNNVWRTTVSGSNVATRTTETNWGTTGHRPAWTRNPKLQQTQFTWYPATGLKESETDPNGLTTTWHYDPFSRVSRLVRSDGTSSRQSYFSCNTGNQHCSDGLLRYMVESSERDTSDAVVTYDRQYFDSLGRVKYEQQLGLSGLLTTVHTMYDARGNVVSRSIPYDTASGYYRGTSFSYDSLNRLVGTQRPVNDSDSSLQSESTIYDGLTVTHTDANGGSQTQIRSAWGQVLRATDQANKHTHYTYNSFGELRTTTDPAGHVTTLQYNIRGFKESSSDPDMGSWTYTYDALGQVRSQTDAKGQQTTFTYDVLNRQYERTDPGLPMTTWNWDTATMGVGKLHSVTAASGYSETYTYDPKGRTATATTIAAGGSYVVSYGYHSTLGVLSTVTYPASIGTPLTVEYGYQNGHLKDVRDTANPTTPLWQAVAHDSAGRVIHETLGNGQQTYRNIDQTTGLLNSVSTGPGGGASTQNSVYRWDRVGNLIGRQDLAQSPSLSETFGYDSLNRLTSISGPSPVSVTYDDIGNIVTKSNVGTVDHSFNYTAAQSGCNYTDLPPQPHAVRNAGGKVYCYDKNGNMTSREGASVTWTSFNYPLTINKVGGNYSTFAYAPDRSRYRQTSSNGATVEERIYIGGLFEKLTVGAATEFRHYVKVAGRIVAIPTRRSSGTHDTYYLHEDHLGSTDVITNQSGAVVVRLSYDGWGSRRDSDGSGSPTSTALAAINASTHLGFTGEEQLDNLDLVHLNGRIYDPVIGRFMSADPVVQSPYQSQSFNRYSYTWNNPLSATDRSGFSCAASRIETVCNRERMRDYNIPEQNEQLGMEEVFVPGRRLTSDAHQNSAQGVLGQMRDAQARGEAQRLAEADAGCVSTCWKDMSLSAQIHTALQGITPQMNDTLTDEEYFDRIREVESNMALAGASGLDGAELQAIGSLTKAAIVFVVKMGGKSAARAAAAFPRSTLHGVSLNWLKRNKPSGWTTSPTRDNKGFIWKDENGGERLRYMRPSGKNPANSMWSRDANGYFRWQDASGNFLDASGNVVSRSHPRFQELTHITYEGPL